MTEGSPALRRFINAVLVHHARAVRHGLAALLGVSWLALVSRLAGVWVDPTVGRPGPLSVDAPAGAPPQVQEWIADLRNAAPDASPDLTGLPPSTPEEVTWLTAAVCKADFDAVGRHARAWRLIENPDLCSTVDRALGVAPLLVWLGPILGAVMSILIAGGVGFVCVWILSSFRRSSDAYDRLYGSPYRQGR